MQNPEVGFGDNMEIHEAQPSHAADLCVGFLLSTSSKAENLSGLHPSFHIVQKMWEYFIDRVDPLTKLVHTPTFRITLMESLQDPQSISKPLQALIFAFYYITISSLDESECQYLLGEEKSSACARYRIAACHALIYAGYLYSSSLTTLQAYTMFLVSTIY